MNLHRTLTRLGRDYAYVLPGFFISLFAFILIVPLFTLGLGTAIIWIGLWILPIVLMMSTGFAALSRNRARLWGARIDEPRYRSAGTGIKAALAVVADPRRWLDLLFETLIAFPLRTVTFVLSVTWTSVALGGLTYMLWGHYIPRDENDFPMVGGMLEALTGGAIADGVATSYLVEAIVYLVIGVVFSLLLPVVMRGLALLDVTTTSAALGAWPASGPAVPAFGARVA